MASLEPILRCLELEADGDGRYRAPNADTGPGVIFGGQLLAQTIAAASKDQPDKRVKTVHTIFARGGAMDAGVEIAVDVMHAGRAFASSTVTISQGERLITRSLVLLSAEEPDLIRHGDPMPRVAGPDESPATSHGDSGWELRIVDGVDIADPDAVGPADLFVWSRFPGAPSDQATNQALVAFATDGFLIGTAMRPHAGVGQAQAHKTLSTGVVSHTLTFHEPVDAGDWVLLAHHSPYAGHGRSYGRADIYAPDGALVGSYVQDNMIRAIPEGRAPSPL